MKKVVLERMETSDEGTFGRIYVDGLLFYTGELPWRDNDTDLSCIPAGQYRADWTMSAHFKRKMYLISPVSSRVGIRMHSANFCGDSTKGKKKQLNGCIAIGEKLGWMSGQKCVLLSAPGIRRFEKLMNHESFLLEVRDAVS